MSEKYWLAQAMMRYGGAFVGSLGITILFADPKNYDKIRKTWPDEVAEYELIAEKLKQEDEAKP